MDDIERILDDIGRRISERSDRGKVASYIPELAKVDPSKFGMAIVLANGKTACYGDADLPFSIQSISKVFSLTLALREKGEELWAKVGREPSGDPFNSIVQLEHDAGIPRNPFINAGAISVMDSLVHHHKGQNAVEKIVSFLKCTSGDSNVSVNLDVAKSEAVHGHRNVALANFMRAYGTLECDPKRTLDAYFKACAISLSCRQLANAGRYLAWEGLLGPGGEFIIPDEMARRINALMLTCGHYDGSGEFAYRVGFPGKSGVGGGILAIVPGRASIAVWSPGLNAVGNSLLGTEALEILARATGWSVFAAHPANVQ